MKTRKRLSVFLAGVMLLVVILPGCGAASTADKGNTTNTAAATAAGGKKEVKKFKLGHDQQKDTGYGLTSDIFANKLKEVSGGALEVEQFPAGQLGQEPQLLQKVRSGDIDFTISTTANASTVSPQAGVFSLHYLFKSEDHLIAALGDPEVNKLFKDLMKETVQGAQILTLHTLGFRHIYAKKEVKSIQDLKGFKIRVQATKTEDTTFAAYGAQTVHMPFGDVYTSIQTGVMEGAENGINVYLKNKHYEVGPVLSLTEHEANAALLWVSDRLWNNLSDQEKQWVQAAADEVGKTQPKKAFELEHQATDKLKSIGVKVVDNVDKTGFIAAAQPIQDQMAKELGPYAEKLLKRARELEKK